MNTAPWAATLERMVDDRPQADRILVAQITGEARHRARWRELSGDEEAAAVQALSELAGGQRRLRCAGDLSKITGTRLAISPDRQLCWLWRSLLVAGRAREAAAQAWMWRQWRPDVTLFPHGAPA
jgi:hypothetical protein